MIELTPGLLIQLEAELEAVAHMPAGGALLALPILPHSDNRILRGPNGEACILIVSRDVVRNVSLKLRNVQARSSVTCEIEAPGGSRQQLAGTLITCGSNDPMMRRMFLAVMEDALRNLGSNPSATSIATWLQRLASLFARLEQEGRKKLRGLWAELIAMMSLGNPTVAARRWHAEASETYDFTAGSFSIEVKSCQDLTRVHHFSLSQLSPPDDQVVWLLSIVVRPDLRGSTVLEALAQLESAIPDPDLRSSLRTMVFSIGGRALEEDSLHRFDQANALATARLIDVRAVPSIAEELPPEVQSVTLEVQCRDLPSAGFASDALARLAGV